MSRRLPPAPSSSTQARTDAVGQVRIIGGQWRNTKLAVPQRPGLRPTSDRVRETLFNWLMPKLPGAQVLDLFAGSGALGLEALSRGAGGATLIEKDAGLSQAISTVATRLQASASVLNTDALAWLARPPQQRFDLVFVDPPFADGLWEQVLAGLPAHLAEDAWLYLEAGSAQMPPMGPGWQLHREGSTREVRYALYRRQGAATLAPDSTP
jgi:16S rRNA (guanine966-N2)-methyltransferase